MGKSQQSNALIPSERIERAFLLIRGQKVLLDMDLAALYGVETKILNQAVWRNMARFPADFMFQLTKAELENWRSQSVTSNPGRKWDCGVGPTPSPSKVWQRFPAFCGVHAP